MTTARSSMHDALKITALLLNYPHLNIIRIDTALVVVFAGTLSVNLWNVKCN